jgi:hypothetical protein
LNNKQQAPHIHIHITRFNFNMQYATCNVQLQLQIVKCLQFRAASACTNAQHHNHPHEAKFSFTDWGKTLLLEGRYSSQGQGAAKKNPGRGRKGRVD